MPHFLVGGAAASWGLWGRRQQRRSFPLDVIFLFLLSHLAHERCRYHGNLLVWVQLC